MVNGKFFKEIFDSERGNHGGSLHSGASYFVLKYVL